LPFEGRRRVTIQNVRPQIDEGRFPAKGVVGDRVAVSADVFADGHDEIEASLLVRRAETDDKWTRLAMAPIGNDRWQAEFTIEERGSYRFTIEAQINRFKTWQHDLTKKYSAGQNVTIELQTGASLIADAAVKAPETVRERLIDIANRLKQPKGIAKAVDQAIGREVSELMAQSGIEFWTTRYERELLIEADRERAGFSTWYEFFPRSFADEPGKHGTFKDCERILPRIAGMGFDVVYLPPIHPIGRTNRKGKNNSIKAEPNDPGSPWAIGAKEGGHKTIHPKLGTLEEFRHFVSQANKHGLEVALDIAFQCSPDHPYIKEHPDWFLWRPDGSIQFAENPPKRYEDVVPFNFETDNWKELWAELADVVLFWAQQGVTIFRVDNPHTKPFAFWQWLIETVREKYPDAIFLSEAFTRPKVMGRLAQIGFTQSYTYFAWRNSKAEIIEYVNQLTQPPLRDYYRPNFWPNTPDILPEFLQYGGRPAFLIRLALAATLTSNYGMYGPAFELCVSDAEPGKEEYLNSEKYEIKHWDLYKRGNISDVITRVNHVRHENPALQRSTNITFLEIDNDYILAYAKATDDLSNLLLIVVNLDPFHSQSGWIRLPLADLGIAPDQPYLVYDLVGDERYIWQGEQNYVELNPRVMPFHIFRVHRRLKREHDFDYYM
jgi:starch synthase (maltosyl-transferring)